MWPLSVSDGVGTHGRVSAFFYKEGEATFTTFAYIHTKSLLKRSLL